MKTTLIKLSLCPCGFPLLHEHIELGTEYEIDPSRQADLVLVCGGCKKRTPFRGVWTEAREGGNPGFLPMDIFKTTMHTDAEFEVAK